MHHACILSFCDVSLQKQIKWRKKERCICFCVLQSSPLEKGLSRQELFEALSGQKLKTPEGSKHKSKVQGGGGQGQSSDADSDVTVTTPEQVESEICNLVWRGPSFWPYSLLAGSQARNVL